MSIYSAIRSILVADSTLVNLVGSKIYPNAAPQGTQSPFVVINVISNLPTNTKAQASTMDRYRIQVSSFSTDFDTCQTVKNRIRVLLENVINTTSSGTTIQVSQFQNEVDGIDQMSTLDGTCYNYSDYFFFVTR